MVSQAWERKTVLILADGEGIAPEKLELLARDAQVVVGVDGGMRWARQAGLMVDLLLGDLDSLEPEIVAEIIDKGTPPIQRFPVQKDAADTQLALDEALVRGASKVILVSGWGNRLDHSLANLHLLAAYSQKFDRLTWETALGSVYFLNPANKTLSLSLAKDQTFSIIPLNGSVQGLTIKGAVYPLDNRTVDWGSTLGVSNQALGGELKISIVSGICSVLLPNAAKI